MFISSDFEFIVVKQLIKVMKAAQIKMTKENIKEKQKLSPMIKRRF